MYVDCDVSPVPGFVRLCRFANCLRFCPPRPRLRLRLSVSVSPSARAGTVTTRGGGQQFSQRSSHIGNSQVDGVS